MKLSLSNLSILYSWFHNRFMVYLNCKSDLWNFESRKLKKKESRFFFLNFCGYVRRIRTLNFLDAVPSPLSELKPPFMRAIWPWWIFDECFDSFDSIEYIGLFWVVQKLEQWANHERWWINYHEKIFWYELYEYPDVYPVKFFFLFFFF